jgi:hypothetical protein
MSSNIKNRLIFITSSIYFVILIGFTLSKIFTTLAINLLALIYSVIKATEIIDKRNRYIKHIPRAIRLNYINYKDEIRLELEHLYTL